jgi:hypothetical protein
MMSAATLSTAWIASNSSNPNITLPHRSIPGTSLTSPLPTVTQTQSICQEMLRARQQWMCLSLPERVRRLAALSKQLCDAGAGDDAAIDGHGESPCLTWHCYSQ